MKKEKVRKPENLEIGPYPEVQIAAGPTGPRSGRQVPGHPQVLNCHLDLNNGPKRPRRHATPLSMSQSPVSPGGQGGGGAE